MVSAWCPPSVGHLSQTVKFTCKILLEQITLQSLIQLWCIWGTFMLWCCQWSYLKKLFFLGGGEWSKYSGQYSMKRVSLHLSCISSFFDPIVTYSWMQRRDFIELYSVYMPQASLSPVAVRIYSFVKKFMVGITMVTCTEISQFQKMSHICYSTM